MTNGALLTVKDLKTHFFSKGRVVRAVDGVSFSLKEGETLGLVGESGCGKSMTCLSILRLVPRPAGRIVSGEVVFEGQDLLKLSDTRMRDVRGKRISMILQDPMSSLNPVFTIGDQLLEAIARCHQLSRQDRLERARQALDLVRIPTPDLCLCNWPHQLSGGMRQRVVGAIAFAGPPRLLIADEPTTALDVTIQAQYLSLLKDIQRQAGLAMIFVTHDFGIVARMCDRVANMYAGKIVEMATVRDVFRRPLHPYTVALMRSVPKVNEKVERLYSIEGEPPRLDAVPRGCSFAPRCACRMDKCVVDTPSLEQVEEDRWVSCWLFAPVSSQPVTGRA